MRGYRVPSIEEVRSMPRIGLKVVSTFSGCGGACLGLRMAGFEVAWASEFIPAAQEVYRANFPDTLLDTRDIRTVRPEEILQATGLKAGELDLLEGSPPCAAFSTSGSREEKWGKIVEYSSTTQRVDDLFFEYVRLLRELQPKVFIAENVSGLIKGSAKGYFLLILEAMKSCGYRVRAQLLNAKYLGVPQSRERVIFMGVREDLGKDPAYPAPQTPVYTFRDAVPEGELPGDAMWLPRGSKGWQLYHHPESVRTGYLKHAHKAMFGAENWLQHTRQAWDRPVPTVCQSSQTIYHPEQARTLSIPELARASSFPDDFHLTGSFSKKWERLGRAVPPLMYRAVGQVIRDQLL